MKAKIKELNVLAHKLKPVVIIGSKGLTEAVQAEINQALEHHELIKIKIAEGDKNHREAIIEEICRHQDALLIKRIGRVFAIYRKKRE